MGRVEFRVGQSMLWDHAHELRATKSALEAVATDV
jgi:hypothetical protein